MKDIQRALKIANNSTSNFDDVKKENFKLQKDLLQERTKVKALSEELENPMNVHRWRKLEGSDPATYEMIQKIQTLQKRLIAMTESCVEKDIIIQEKEKLYVELMTILSRQPGPEVAEQLNIYQQDLRRRNVLMKSMASELNMSSTQSAEYRYEIERLNRELQEVKKHYFELKMKNSTLLEEKAMMAQTTGGAAMQGAAQPNAAAAAGMGVMGRTM